MKIIMAAGLSFLLAIGLKATDFEKEFPATFEQFKECVEKQRCYFIKNIYIEDLPNEKTIESNGKKVSYSLKLLGAERYQLGIGYQLGLIREAISDQLFLKCTKKENGDFSVLISVGSFGKPTLNNCLVNSERLVTYEGSNRGSLLILEEQGESSREERHELLACLKDAARIYFCKEIIIANNLVSKLSDEEIQWYLDRNFRPTPEGLIFEIAE